jgi:hypothetical protein
VIALGWGYFALVGSFVFILAQLLLLVDFSHAWASSWMGKVEDGNRKYLFGWACVFIVVVD